MEEFIGAMGYKIFTHIVNKTSNDESKEPILYLKYSNSEATGIRTSEGFAVLKGSRLSSKLTNSCPERAKNDRKKYSSKIDENYFLTEDVLLSSPSAAAAFVGGASLNGNEKWHTDDGTSLKNWDLGE